MINKSNLQYVISIFGNDYTVENEESGEVTYHCPFCPELGHRNDDRKMYVNVNKLKYICFRCESKGKLRHELSSEFSNTDIYGVFKDYINNDTYNEEETSYYNIPSDKLVDNKDSTAYEYMKSRGFTDEDMDKYSMRLPGLGHLAGRVIVPNKIISKNWTDIYVARSYLGSELRYKNPYNSKKSRILYNYHRIPDNPEYMILNEGPLNSIIAGDLSVASFGKSLSIDQRNLILQKHPKKLYVSYDTDALEKSLKLCDDIIGLSSIEVYLVRLPEKWSDQDHKMKGMDAVDLGRDQYLDIVFNSPRFINSKIFKIMEGFKRLYD